MPRSLPVGLQGLRSRLPGIWGEGLPGHGAPSRRPGHSGRRRAGSPRAQRRCAWATYSRCPWATASRGRSAAPRPQAAPPARAARAGPR